VFLLPERRGPPLLVRAFVGLEAPAASWGGAHQHQNGRSAPQRRSMPVL